MYVIDNEGRIVDFQNLDKAIAFTDKWRKYKHTGDDRREMDKILGEYWNDLYRKLIQLRK